MSESGFSSEVERLETRADELADEALLGAFLGHDDWHQTLLAQTRAEIACWSQMLDEAESDVIAEIAQRTLDRLRNFIRELEILDRS